MMIYRSLNDSDMELEPLKNGLYSKLNIKLATESLFDFLLAANGITLTKGSYKSELSEFKKNSVKYSLSRIIELTNEKNNRLNVIKKHMSGYIENKDYDALAPFLIDFFDITSTKNSHILHGNKYASDWISFTKDIETLKFYYLNQKKKHMVAGMDSNINIILDCDTIAYDMSSKELARKNPFLYNKSRNTGLYKETDLDSMAVRYANSRAEVLYYNHVPSERLFTLGPLQVDMLYNGMLSKDYLNASKEARETINHLLIYILKYKLKDKSLLTNYALEKLYIDSIPLSTLSAETGINYYELLNAKEEILKVLNDIHATDLLNKIKKPVKKKIKAIER